MATLRSPTRRSASTQPTAPQYTPRGTGSSAPMWAEAASFGAPVTEPGGNVASMAAAHPHPGRSRPVTVDTRWTSPGCCSTDEQRGHLDGAELADPAEVVAHEVDDHDVLGPVLGGEARRGQARCP